MVKSPSDGVVGTLPYRVGALVSSSLPQPLTTVSDNSDMYVYFSMNETQLLELIRQYGSKDEALKRPAPAACGPCSRTAGDCCTAAVRATW